MSNDLRAKLAKMHSDLEPFCKRREELAQKLEPRFQAFHKIVGELGPSHSGSWLGYHSELYYQGFQRPPPRHRFNVEWGAMRLAGPWMETSFDEVREAIEKELGFTLDNLFDEVNPLRDEAKQFLDELLFQVSPLRDRPGFEAETKLLDDLDGMSWGFSAEDFAKYQMPKNYMTHDTRAAAEGPRAPPHIMLDANVMAIQSRLTSVKEFCKNARRVLRQSEAKLDLESATLAPGPSSPADLVTTICKGFHRAARQLRSRHKNRETLKVEDEYDVQDLLHAFLVLHFTDVRPEEYTPSYAGGSARMDFLLKREKVVIEVKRTREGLADKEVGEQLIIDIARYKAHSDCSLLVCFVYDPEGRIGNPRGLESDLAALATDALGVVVFIEPS